MLQEVTKPSSARSWQKMCLGKLPSTGVGSAHALCGGPDSDRAARSLWECWAQQRSSASCSQTGTPLGGWCSCLTNWEYWIHCPKRHINQLVLGFLMVPLQQYLLCAGQG